MNEATWVGLAALTITSLFALLSKRDSNRHDTEIATLKVQQRQCEEEAKQCAEDRATDRAALAAATRTLKEHDERDKRELQNQIDTLKRQVNAP